MKKQTIKREFEYKEGHTYWVMRPRSAWDTVEMGLYESKSDVDRDSPLPFGGKRSLAREATEKEVTEFFGLQ